MEQQRKSMSSSDLSVAIDQNEPLTIIQQFCQFVFPTLLGTPSLETLVEIAEQDEKKWSKLIDRLTTRTSNITIVGSLASSATIGFLTTTPPTGIVTWNHQFPYFCIATSSGSALLAVMSGLCLILYLSVVRPESVRELQKSMFKRVSVAMLLMMPVIFLFFAAFCIVVAWIAAIWFGNQTWLKAVGTILTVSSAVVVVFLFLVIGAVY
ncbi:hypothetical protein F5J12DRAFT_852730 [Pisolithus orientalis]|uniref:uncharacterized protein n=1 Tax=Pisolithus orientalis TaxID=936130 RepID=UPI0022257861|nr:uncharacterized protein F5J12DRAFT_852730 [Pisolithus orientalis]KAI5996878.1 hypothetical protein F5J12DRAFT_852730 [Pisolithus orientalis]